MFCSSILAPHSNNKTTPLLFLEYHSLECFAPMQKHDMFFSTLKIIQFSLMLQIFSNLEKGWKILKLQNLFGHFSLYGIVSVSYTHLPSFDQLMRSFTY